MNIPWKLLRGFAAFVILTWAWLALNEAALPADRKADRLPLFPQFNLCAAIDYQQGSCL